MKPITLTKLDLRLENHDEIMDRYNKTGRLDIAKENSISINRIGQADIQHDIDYISKDLQDRHVDNVKMIHQINNIPNPTFREKLERFIVKSIMKSLLERFRKTCYISSKTWRSRYC